MSSVSFCLGVSERLKDDITVDEVSAHFQYRERTGGCHEMQVGEDYLLLLPGGSGTAQGGVDRDCIYQAISGMTLWALELTSFANNFQVACCSSN